MLDPPGTIWQCPDCGYRVTGGYWPDTHECDDITLEHYPRRLCAQLAAHADDAFAQFLRTPHGRFAQYLVRRDEREAA
jgi:hypothetical protein